MRRALVALLFLVACKDKKPEDSASTATPTATEKPSTARQRPSLPAPGESPGMGNGPVPHLSGGGSDGDWAAQREERRKEREAKLDTNHDGVVSDEERLQRAAPMRDRLDTNHDGKLTPDELAASQRRMFADPAKIDTNKDGDISLAELDAAIEARRDEMRERWRHRQEGGGSDAMEPFDGPMPAKKPGSQVQ